MSGFTIGWIAWAVVTGVWFAAEEGAALVTHARAGTLSAHLREWFHTSRKAGRWTWLVVFGLGAAWLLVHIATPAGYLG